MSKKWTDSELKYLVDNYSKSENELLAKELKKTKEQIKYKASVLGLNKPRGFSNKRYEEELKYLNEVYTKDNVPIDVAFKHKDWLYTKYVTEELTTEEIATITGCDRKNISYWLSKQGIDTRNASNISERTRNKMSIANTGRPNKTKGKTKYNDETLKKISDSLSGEKSSSWKGGKIKNSKGYTMIMVKGHPKGDKDGYVLEHRLVMEGKLKRYLTDTEVVHHRDSNRSNNIIGNLFLFPSNKSHTSFHNYKKYIDNNITEEKFMEEIYSD